MKNITNMRQEVLLMTTTRFASRQYSETDAPANAKNIPANEQLKEACWNGLLSELLPEIFTYNKKQGKMFLWQIREGRRFFALELSQFPGTVDKYESIDPYRFMEVQELN